MPSPSASTTPGPRTTPSPRHSGFPRRPSGACFASPPPFAALDAPFLHAGLARQLVLELKYRGHRHLALPLARLAVGGVLFYAGFIKALNPAEFAAALEAYHLLPARLLTPLA